jgi:NADH-quinone oxidoreductase subunit F
MEEREPTVRVTVDSDGGPAVLVAAREAAEGSAVREVGPTGITALSPLVLATLGDSTAFHANCTPERAVAIVESLDAGDLPTEGAYAIVEHGTISDLPIPASGPLAVGGRRVLGRCGWAEPTAAPPEEIADRPDEVFETVRKTGLLGRGRGDAAADAPVAEQWVRARETAGEPVVVVNGNEADPGAAMDRTLLEGAPAEVLDAALAVAAAVGEAVPVDVVVYLNEADELARERVAAAAAALGAAIDVVVGPDLFIAGEPTMALEAMEGADRLEARLRPPGPAEYGLFGRPTVVHTPRTFAQGREAVLHGVGFDAADPGTRLVTVTGDVRAPATVEVPTGRPLSDALAAVGDPAFKMAGVGGRFGGLTRRLDVPASAPALAAAGLGTEGVVELFDDSRCAVAMAGHRARFAREENCGRCVPCREGSTQLHELLRDVYGGRYEDAKLRELCRVMGATSVCDFGRAAARPVLTAMDEFEAEFRAHADGRCPTGECEVRP